MKLGFLLQSLLVKILLHRRIVSGVLGLLLFLIGGALFLYPKVISIQQIGILDLNREERQLTERQDYLVRLQRSLEQFRTIDASQADALSAILPSEQDLPGLFVALDDLMKQSGLTLSSVSITAGGALTSSTAPNLPANLRTLNIQLVTSTGADYTAVKRLLANVEVSQRLFDLTAISFTPLGLSSQGPSTATLSLRTYFLSSAG